jgi:pyruvate ferredoxin oxidoreductase alpha subunit
MTPTAVVGEEKGAGKDVEKTALITGSEAIAVACKLADVDVVTGYPIRPYDTVIQYIAKLIADGDLDCEYVVAEGEHSQFEMVKHASMVGARVFCGSSGVGWMYAFECLTVTPALRVPMVCMVGNRALDDPGAFGVEHNDALAVRDLGWQLVWVDSAQEALDTALIAYRVAEDRRIFLPCAISCDGAFLTHSQALVKIPSQAKADSFLPRYNRGDLLLHPDNPISVAPQANEDWLMEIRRQTAAAMERSAGVIREAYKDFEKIFGRSYGNPFFEEYMTEDADVVLVGMAHVVHAGQSGHPQDAQGRKESRVRARSLVPAVCRGRIGHVPVAVQGRGRDRS